MPEKSKPKSDSPHTFSHEKHSQHKKPVLSSYMLLIIIIETRNCTSDKNNYASFSN